MTRIRGRMKYGPYAGNPSGRQVVAKAAFELYPCKVGGQ